MRRAAQTGPRVLTKQLHRKPMPLCLSRTVRRAHWLRIGRAKRRHCKLLVYGVRSWSHQVIPPAQTIPWIQRVFRRCRYNRFHSHRSLWRATMIFTSARRPRDFTPRLGVRDLCCCVAQGTSIPKAASGFGKADCSCWKSCGRHNHRMVCEMNARLRAGGITSVTNEHITIGQLANRCRPLV